LKVTLLSPAGPSGLSPRPPLPAGRLERGVPEIRGHTYFADAAAGVGCLVWGATPYRTRPTQRSDYEFSILLEGRFTLTNGNGEDVAVQAGDVFVLPPAFTYQWGQDVPTLKFALSFTPPEAPQPGLVFNKFAAGELAGAASGQSRTLFCDPSGRFCLRLDDLSLGSGHVIGAGYTLLTPIDGAVTLHGGDGAVARVGRGEVAFVASATACDLPATEPARLLACTIRTTPQQRNG
jgi:uncharacterized cupin superfamily protein